MKVSNICYSDICEQLCTSAGGQETPGTNKRLREDLYKKFMSAEGISGRKPYGLRTRMIETRGWKRLEANRMFQFQQVSKKDFNAILRRSFVWRAVARFEDARAVEGAYEDMWRDGVFPKDPDLKQFLVSGPAILAALQIQNAFEMKFSKDDCERLIEDYAYWGGDRGLTEDTMREACGMPPRDVRHVTTQAASVIVVDNEPGDAEDPQLVWNKVAGSLMNSLFTTRRLDITKPMLLRSKLKDVPNMNKEQLINSMLANKRLIQSFSRGKTDDVFTIGLTTTVKLDTLIHHMDRTSCPVLSERHAISTFTRYVTSPGRSENSETLATLFKSLSTKVGRVGRPTSSAKLIKEKYDEKASKILSHEKDCQSLLKKLSDERRPAASQASPAKKRLRTKAPEVEMKEEPVVKQEIADADGEMKVFPATYAYPETTTLRTRKIVQGLGAQKFTRRAQQHLLPHTHDLDIHNSVFTVMSQVLDKLQVDPALPQDVRSALDRCVSDRDKVCSDELRTTREEGKQILTAVLYGGAIPQHLAGNQFLVRLSKVSLYMRWLAISLLEDEFHRFRSPSVNKKNPDMSILSHLYLAAEDCILTAWVTFLETLKPLHLSLHFDGVRVSLPGDYCVRDICKACESHIQTSTGFRVSIREKQHRTVLQSIEQKSTQEPRMTTNQCQLEKYGNCIPAAIAATLGRQAFVEEALAAEMESVYKLSRDALAEAIDSGVDSSTCIYFRVLESDANVQEFVNEELDDEDVTTLLTLEAAGKKRPAAAPPTKTMTHNRTEGLKTRKLGVLKRPSQNEAAAPAVDSANFRVLDESVDPVPSCSDQLDDEDVASLLNLEASGHKRPASIQEPPQASSESGDEVAVVDIPSDTASTGAVEGDDPPDDGEPGCNRWLEDGAVVITDSVLLGSLAKEVSDHIRQGQFVQVMNKYSCPLCPWRSFQSPSRVKEHLSKYHVAKNQYCCSGTKQLKCVLSLHDSDMIAGARHGKYLLRSAQVLREQVQPPLPSSVNWIDKSIRLVLDSTGPRRPFAEQLFQEIVLHHAKAREFRTYAKHLSCFWG
eukprot:s785_g7.t1